MALITTRCEFHSVPRPASPSNLVRVPSTSTIITLIWSHIHFSISAEKTDGLWCVVQAGPLSHRGLSAERLKMSSLSRVSFKEKTLRRATSKFEGTRWEWSVFDVVSATVPALSPERRIRSVSFTVRKTTSQFASIGVHRGTMDERLEEHFGENDSYRPVSSKSGDQLWYSTWGVAACVSKTECGNRGLLKKTHPTASCSVLLCSSVLLPSLRSSFTYSSSLVTDSLQ